MVLEIQQAGSHHPCHQLHPRTCQEVVGLGASPYDTVVPYVGGVLLGDAVLLYQGTAICQWFLEVATHALRRRQLTHLEGLLPSWKDSLHQQSRRWRAYLPKQSQSTGQTLKINRVRVLRWALPDACQGLLQCQVLQIIIHNSAWIVQDHQVRTRLTFLDQHRVSSHSHQTTAGDKPRTWVILQVCWVRLQ